MDSEKYTAVAETDGRLIRQNTNDVLMQKIADIKKQEQIERACNDVAHNFYWHAPEFYPYPSTQFISQMTSKEFALLATQLVARLYKSTLKSAAAAGVSCMATTTIAILSYGSDSIIGVIGATGVPFGIIGSIVATAYTVSTSIIWHRYKKALHTAIAHDKLDSICTEVQKMH